MVLECVAFLKQSLLLTLSTCFVPSARLWIKRSRESVLVFQQLRDSLAPGAQALLPIIKMCSAFPWDTCYAYSKIRCYPHPHTPITSGLKLAWNQTAVVIFELVERICFLLVFQTGQKTPFYCYLLLCSSLKDENGPLNDCGVCTCVIIQ